MAKQCNIQYIALDDNWRKEQKLQWFTENPLKEIPFEHIQPDKNNSWINIADNDFENLLALCNKDVKAGKSKKAIFELFSTGFLTGRDEWVVDFSKMVLGQKMNLYISEYQKHIIGEKNYDGTIKWSRNLKRRLEQGKTEIFDEHKINPCSYRPFTNPFLYNSDLFIDEKGAYNNVSKNQNIYINFRYGSRLDFCCLSTLYAPSYSFYSLDPCQYISMYRFDIQGNRIENITDWGLQQFTKQYGKKGVTKEAIFHYVYAVLHNPAYRKKYELNLKREFPRIPFYNDFKQWSLWGEDLMNLHINYATVKPFKLDEIVAEHNVTNQSVWEKLSKPKLKANKVIGEIEIDGFTTLMGIPKQAWEYKLGNRSALEWVLDQYKESKPKDPTIAEKFNTYKFADYKDQVLDLLKKVCTVSVETMKIVGEMEKQVQ